MKLRKSSDEEEEFDEETENELPELEPIKPKQSKTLTKEEIGALAEYHQARAIELLNIYRRLI